MKKYNFCLLFVSFYKIRKKPITQKNIKVKNILHNYKGIKVLHIYNAHYFQEKTKFEKVAKLLHNYKISVIIDVIEVQHVAQL